MITTFGEIMLRVSPENSGERIIQANKFRIEPGGSEANVAIALSNLGLKSAFISCLPDNGLSQIVFQYLGKYRVETSHIITRGSRVGLYWTETGLGQRNSFVIYDRENSAFSECCFDDFDWTEIFNGTSWFHFSGISPAIGVSVAEILQKVVGICTCPYSVDLNFREKLWSWVDRDHERIDRLMSALCENATLIAGNETDFQSVFGFGRISGDDDIGYTRVANACFNKFKKAKYIAISRRSSVSATINNWSGYLFVKGDDQFMYKGPEYYLDNIVDRIGTGDSFVAGIIYGMNKLDKFRYKEVVDFAVTLSALNHTTVGDASYFNELDVINTMKDKGSGRIMR